jgi:hypothetical protein
MFGLIDVSARGLHPFIKESFCCAQGVWDSDGPLLIFGIIRQRIYSHGPSFDSTKSLFFSRAHMVV